VPAINLTDRVLAVQYTGSNSAEIDGLITDFDIVSEAGGTLTFNSGGNPYIANTNDWVRYTQGFVLNVHTTASLDFLFIRNAVYADLPDTSGIEADVAELQTDVAALEAAGGLRSAGVKECPLLIVGNTTVSVDIIPAMPDTSYTPNAQLFASVALLGSLSVTGVTVVDTNTVDVVVNNSGLIGLNGAAVLVTVT
jgi:hypothetical protein